MRADFPTVKPVIHEGIRYDVTDDDDQYDQFGGIIGAFDVRTGERLWTLQVYKVDFSSGMERDAADILISSISLTDNKQSLLIVNELGTSFSVNLDTKEVTPPSKTESRPLVRSHRRTDNYEVPEDALQEPPEIDQNLLKKILDNQDKH